MKASKYQWQLPEPQELSQEYATWIQDYQLSPFIGKILWQRGIRTKESLADFFDEDLNHLHDPFLMHDMQKAIERIQEAVLSGQRILVYGDYDADGITSTTIMKETLELLGADVEYFLPNRFHQGYGPNLEKYQEKIAEGIELILTVDNGVSGHDAITYAQSQGVDVIVTDHHELPAVLPEAYAIVHPRHPEGDYPFGDLAGVGVAFKVATALLEEVPVEFLDLVAIGTLADLVSLTGENRLLVKAGLKIMPQTERVGLLALLEKSGVTGESFTETDIGFSIAPRLNAIGRLGDPNPAVELMSTFDEEQAKSLAEYLNKQNDERKAIVEKITQEALTMVNEELPVQLLAKAGWHEGVLGIVAGNILHQTGKPAILLTIKEDGTAKGSGRSTEQLNLFEMLDTMRELFQHFGGHHAAVGLTMAADNLTLLQQKILAYMEIHDADLTGGPALRIDEELMPADITLPFIQSLQQLAPYGTDNPVPIFLLKQVEPQQVKALGANQQHLKFSIGEQANLDAIAFNFGAQVNEFKGAIDVVGQLSINEWNGRKKPQLQLKDYRVDGKQFFDWRAKFHWNQPIDAATTMIVAFNKQSKKILPAPLQEKVFDFESLEQLTAYYQEGQFQQLAVLDIPDQLEDFQDVVAMGDFSRIYFYGFTSDEAYLNGLGSREQYARLFKLINQQKSVDVRYKLDQLVDFLKIPKSLLIFMIQVLDELAFVKVENGLLSSVEVKEKHPLTDSKKYQKRMQQIKNEEFLLLADGEKIMNWLLQGGAPK